jgi:type II restriction enzyme
MVRKMNKKRSFSEIIGALKPSISDYGFFTDFVKVFNNVSNLMDEINELNKLIGISNFEQEFEKTIERNPRVLQTIPLLLAKRDTNVIIYNDGKSLEYEFSTMHNSIEDYADFIEKTGLIELFNGRTISNFYDYLIGIEAGLDSNARKNRSGVAMSNIVEHYLQISGHLYKKEVSTKAIYRNYGIDISIGLDGNTHAQKRFDFAIQTEKFVYLIETNFYSSVGSKLNETARSYRQLNQDLKSIDNIRFVWITDGIGWENVIEGLKETYDSMEYLYTIYDLEMGLFENLD